MKFNITEGDWKVTKPHPLIATVALDLEAMGLRSISHEEFDNNMKAIAAVPQMLALLEKSRLMLLGVDLLKSTGNKNCLALSEEITSFLSQFEAK